MRSASEEARTIVIERQKCVPDDLPPFVILAHRHLEKAPSAGESVSGEIHCTLPVDMIRKTLNGTEDDPPLPSELVDLIDQIESAQLVYQPRRV